VSATILRTTDLVGTWRLATWVGAADDGSIKEPFGSAPLGYVMYTVDGHMITTISQPDRAATGGDVPSGATEPSSAAASTFMAYSGPFRVDGDDVVHTLELSLLPDWIGTDQRRHVDLSDDGQTLILSTDPMVAGNQHLSHRLTWHRVAG
jgi:hypothetical protein